MEPKLKVVFCTEHNSIWGDQEESFSIENEHCEFWYWMDESNDFSSSELNKCVPVNATVSW